MSRSLAVIGLDGVGLEMARRLAEAGVMPNLARLMKLAPAWGVDSPLPEVSSVCWSTLFTALNPGGHGIFGFAHPRPDSYKLKPVESTDVAAPRLWELVEARGAKAVVVNVPLTYPARQMRGVMISGFVVVDMARAVHPPALLQRLEAIGYRPEPDLDRARRDKAGFLAELAEVLRIQARIIQELAQEQWDLFVAVVTATDRVNHFCWQALNDPHHPLHNQALDIYRITDQLLGGLWEGLAPRVEAGQCSFAVVADHAFGPIKSEVYLNPWMMEHGYLHIQGCPPHEQILPNTTALVLDPARVYLHLAGRFPKGQPMAPSRIQAIKEAITAQLTRLEFLELSGRQLLPRRVIERVFSREELYHGPLAHTGPELVAVGAEGFSLRAGLDRGGLFGRSHIEGTHRPYGALALLIPPPASRPTHLVGLGRLLMKLAGISWAVEEVSAGSDSLNKPHGSHGGHQA